MVKKLTSETEWTDYTASDTAMVNNNYENVELTKTFLVNKLNGKKANRKNIIYYLVLGT